MMINAQTLHFSHLYIFTSLFSVVQRLYASHWHFISMKSDSSNEGASCSKSFPCSSIRVDLSVSQKGSGKGKMTGKSLEHENDTIRHEQKYNTIVQLSAKVLP